MILVVSRVQFGCTSGKYLQLVAQGDIVFVKEDLDPESPTIAVIAQPNAVTLVGAGEKSPEPDEWKPPEAETRAAPVKRKRANRRAAGATARKGTTKKGLAKRTRRKNATRRAKSAV